MPLANVIVGVEEGDWYTVGLESVGVAVTVVAVIAAKKLGPKMGPQSARGPPVAHDHHVMTNKNYVSGVRGGPWSPKFEDMAKKAGMTLEDAENRVRVPGHGGPHPRAYHEEVFKRLDNATKGLRGDAYSQAFHEELGRIRSDAANPGSRLNKLITR